MNEPVLHFFDNREALIDDLGDRIATALADAIELRGRAMIAVSGGSTPKNLFKALSDKPIAWDRVTVTLVDERFVPPSNERSNHRLVAANLLQNAASAAEFVPLYQADREPVKAAKLASEAIEDFDGMLDVAILGMGEDGHTASWFPGNGQLSELTKGDQSSTIMAAEGEGVSEPRLTMTLPILASARFLVLHIEGEKKKATLDTALEEGPVDDYPVRAILRNASQPVQIYWAP
jgi:6-phosphogluconolactonase